MIVMNAMLDERRKRDNARSRAYYHANRKRLRESNDAWKKANPQSVLKHRKTQLNRYHHLSKEQRKDWGLKQNYGITYDQFAAMLESQAGCCAICGTKMVVWEGKGRKDGACVDHCHSTGVVRGLLCGACNRGIGLFGDDPERLAKASQYLLAPPPPPPPPNGAEIASEAPEGGGAAVQPRQPPPEMMP